MKKLIIIVLLLCHGFIVKADNQLQLVGQFGSKAVLMINGNQRIIKINQVSSEGVKLLQVEPDYVVVLDNGQKKKVTFSTQMRTKYTKPKFSEINIWANSTGSYVTAGSINGQVVDFLVDTGATSIAMNENTAQRLGIDFRYVGKPITVTTASGVVTGYTINLNLVKVGDIQLHNVEGAVLEGGYPTEVLLGMSFLRHVSLERNNNLMTLKYKK